MKIWPTDEARVQFLCSSLRERSVNELSYDNKVAFWIDFCKSFCRETSKLSFSTRELEDYVLTLCPFRPICVEQIIRENYGNDVTTKEDYENSLTWASWSYSVITSPIRKIKSYSPMLQTKKIRYIHKQAVSQIITDIEKLLVEKINEDATWSIMSYDEFFEISKLNPADLELFLKAGDVSYDDELKVIKVGKYLTVSANDAVWTSMRLTSNQLAVKMENIENDIIEQTNLIKNKIRNKTEKSILLRLVKRKKKLEKIRDDLFNKQLNVQEMLENYRQALENNMLCKTLTKANDDLTKINNKFDIDDVHDLMDSIAEAHENREEIADVLSTTVCQGEFDQDLEDELEALLQTEEKDDISDLMSDCKIAPPDYDPVNPVGMEGSGDQLNQ